MTDQRTRIATRQGKIDPQTVFGWGVDANPENDPTYPYRDRSADEGLTKDWHRPAQQESEVEILRSIEHVRTPAVFGTSAPPSGVSGLMRRAAFRWSESNWLHWLLLMGADRVNVVEGLVSDVAHGKIPNIPAEMGARSEWQHNKKGFLIKSALVIGATAGLVALVRSRSTRGESEQAPAPVPAEEAAAQSLPLGDMTPATGAFERYETAMAELSDAGGMASAAGPAV